MNMCLNHNKKHRKECPECKIEKLEKAIEECKSYIDRAQFRLELSNGRSDDPDSGLDYLKQVLETLEQKRELVTV